MAERGADVIKTMMRMGVMATINQAIDPEAVGPEGTGPGASPDGALSPTPDEPSVASS